MTRPERRDNRRAIVGPQFTVSFSVRGHAFRNVRITNLSPQGCFALVGRGDARLFPQGALLERLTMEHPELPQGPITAEVRYTLGGESGSSSLEFLGLGIQFLSVAPEVLAGLEGFLLRTLGPLPD